MFIRFCIAVLVVIAGALLTFAFLNDDGQLAVYAIPVVLLIAAALAFKPQLDWAYYTRNPIDLDEPLRRLFADKLPAWYQGMSEADRLAFRQNTSLARRGIDFKGQGFPDDTVPEDFAVLLASQLARFLPDGVFVIPPFETVVVYKHRFPSPQYPEQWHSSELFVEDGVLLFDVEQAIPGIFDPEGHFNIVLYEWIRAARLTGHVSRDSLEAIDELELSAALQRRVLDAIGLAEPDIDWSAAKLTLQHDGLLMAPHTSASQLV